MRLRTILPIAVGVLGIAAGVAVMVTPTRAPLPSQVVADITPGYTDTTSGPNAGSGDVVGLDVAELGRWSPPITSSTYTDYDAGGWTTDTTMTAMSKFQTCGSQAFTAAAICPPDTGTGPGGITAPPYTPVVSCFLQEPMLNIYGDPYRDVMVGLACDRFDNSGWFASANVVVGPTAPVVTCAATARSNAGDDWTQSSSSGGGGDNENRDDTRQWQRLDVTTGARSPDAGCPYIVSVAITFTWPSTVNAVTTKTFTWTAAQALTPRHYGTRSDGAGACVALNSTARSALCDGLVVPDGTDFSQVCGNPPTGNPFDPAWIGYYAHCLFFPVNGWDSDHSLQDAISGSSLGQGTAAIYPAVYAITATQGDCGYIFNGNAGILGHIALSTCSWSGWAGPLQQVLGWGVYLMGGWMIIEFLFGELVGALGADSPFGKIRAAQKAAGDS